MTGSSRPDFATLPRWLLDSLGEGVTIADVDGRIVYSNRAADRILGVGASAGLPKEWADHYGLFLPDGRTRFPADHYPLVRALRGESTNDIEMVVRNRHHPWDVRIAVTGRPILDEAGTIVGATVVFRDVTDAMGAQTTLARLNDELRRVQGLQEELSGFLMHDLNGPLTGILALTEILLVREDLEDGVRGSVQEIKDLADSVHALVIDLLDLKIAEDGALRPEWEALDVDEVLAQAVSVLAPRAEVAGKCLVVDAADEGLSVYADRDLLTRILQNLVDNSIKYAPPGGEIRLAAAPGAGATVRFSVSDQGPGVPERLRERLFDKYAAVERDERPRSRTSRGMGLRFCRMAAEAQRGRIWVEDAAPAGARFCLELPRPR